MIVTHTTNLGYVTGKGDPASKVTPRFLTISVGETEFPSSCKGEITNPLGIPLD